MEKEKIYILIQKHIISEQKHIVHCMVIEKTYFSSLCYIVLSCLDQLTFGFVVFLTVVTEAMCWEKKGILILIKHRARRDIFYFLFFWFVCIWLLQYIIFTDLKSQPRGYFSSLTHFTSCFIDNKNLAPVH